MTIRLANVFWACVRIVEMVVKPHGEHHLQHKIEHDEHRRAENAPVQHGERAAKPHVTRIGEQCGGLVRCSAMTTLHSIMMRVMIHSLQRKLYHKLARMSLSRMLTMFWGSSPGMLCIRLAKMFHARVLCIPHRHVMAEL